jgi:hypothetical protein
VIAHEGSDSRPIGFTQAGTTLSIRSADDRSTICCLRALRPPTSSGGQPLHPIVRPAKADAFSGGQSRRGKSQGPVAWMAGRRETDVLKPIDTAIFQDGRRAPGP